ncbi:sensor histidine kinase [Nocardia sp. NPDC049149]|uniref:sensor histidine kinase n=1 Tax=Nocardia sp. NPDC049149 TaxID=3364315 RepID=UPI003714632A
MAERARMAREIHDVLAGSLGLLGIQLEVLHTVLADLGDVDSALKLLVELQQTAREGLKETHRAVHGLRSELRPLDQELAALVDRHREVQHTEVTLTVADAPQWPTPETALALVRVTGEALVNAAKHAPHQPITVVLRYESGDVVLTVENPLNDNVSDQRYRTVDGGYGLLGMRERLLPLGGTVIAGARQGRWVVTARVPN